MGAVVSAVVCCGGCAAGRSWVGCAACDSAGCWGVISRGCVCSAGCCCGGFAAGALLGLAVPPGFGLGAWPASRVDRFILPVVAAAASPPVRIWVGCAAWVWAGCMGCDLRGRVYPARCCCGGFAAGALLRLAVHRVNAGVAPGCLFCVAPHASAAGLSRSNGSSRPIEQHYAHHRPPLSDGTVSEADRWS